MPKIDTLKMLYLEQLKELYSAEIQLIDALPEMVQAAHDPELKADFQRHLGQAYRHIERIEHILENMEQSPNGHKCNVIFGLVKEGKTTIRNEALAAARDAALIEIAQRIAHYEIASYGCIRIYALLMGDEEAAEMLQMTLDEKAEMDREITGMTEKLHVDYRGGSVPLSSPTF